LVTLCIGSYSPRPNKKRTESFFSASDQQPPSIRLSLLLLLTLLPQKPENKAGKQFVCRAAPVFDIAVPPVPFDGDQCEQGAILSALLT